MKRHLLTLIALLFVLTTSMKSQSNFKLTQTDYVGALSCDPALDWTQEGWTNFDPKNANYPDPTDTITLNGMISSLPIPGEKNLDAGTVLRLDSTKVYLLQGFFVVRSGAKLVIPAGTIIRAHGDLNASPVKNYATINVERGGQIEILGEPTKPVILTSSKPIGQRDRGDYGGLVLAGRSTHNLLNGTDNNNVQMEGYNNVTFDPNLAHFGGTDVNDNSGIVKYFRAEFGGVAFELNKEINGITLGAVGAGTEFHHIQVSYSGDDSYEWFGGTLNSHHLIAWKGTDDDFDTDNGYRGISQFGIGVRDSAYYDLSYSLPSGGSTSEGFESDNEATGTADVRPYTSAVFSNYTMIGPVPVGSKWSDMNPVTRAAFRRGARIRRNSCQREVNSIFMGYRNMIMIDGDSCIHNTNFPAALALVSPSTPVDVKTKQISFANNLIVNTADAFNTPNDSTANGLVEVTKSTSAVSYPKLVAINSWARQSGPMANNIDPVPFTAGTVLVNPISASTSPNFRPVYSTVNSPALSGSNFKDNPTISGFNLVQTDYVGALSSDAAQDWTKEGWSNFDPKNANYPDPTDTITLNGMVSTLPIVGEKNIDSGTVLTLDASKVYLLQGFVVVRKGGKLVIPAGTIIRAHGDLNASPVKNYATINVERGGQIEILGEPTKPVILTSSKPIGQRDRGDYGGLVLAGRSTHNLLNGTDNNNVQMEGYNNVSFDPNLAHFGGTDVNDNSGIVKYFRAEFGGVAFELNKEINGITLGAVGAGTEFHHIQVSYSGDDSYEWFGGTLNSHHLIAWKGTDDDFDTDNGYRGISQFGIGVRDSAYYDLSYSLPSGGSTSEGFESDNEATGTADVRPYTSAVFSNYTMIGPVPVGSKWSDMNPVTRAAFRRGARIRRNSCQREVNSIFMGYRNMIMIDGDSCIHNTNFPAALALVSPSTPVDIQTKQISFANNLIVNTANAFNTPNDSTANGLVEVTKSTSVVSYPKLVAINSWARQSGPLANNIDPVPFTAGTVLVNPLSASKTPDFRPVYSVTSPACSGANFKDNPVLDNLVSTHNEIENAKYSPVYPNPVSNGNLYFGHEVLSYGIFDLSGRLVGHGFNEDHAIVNFLPKGMYFIKLEGKVQKFLIQ